MTARLDISQYRVIVIDELQSALAGHHGIIYQSPPQSRQHAAELARVLVGPALAADEPGPWRQARPGGTRTVRLEPAP